MVQEETTSTFDEDKNEVNLKIENVRSTKKAAKTLKVTKDIKCLQCNFVTKHPGNLSRHIYGMHKKRFFACQEASCEKTYTTKQQLNKHKQLVHRKEQIMCDLCGYVSHSHQEFNVHQRSAHKKRKNTCDVCKIVFRKKVDLIAHGISKHGNVSPFQCDLCSKSFSYQRGLKRHRELCSNMQRGFLCPKCGKNFTRAESLRDHERVKHQPVVTDNNKQTTSNPPTFQCEKCSKTFLYRQALCRHRKQCLIEKNRCFVCSACGKNFKHSGALRNHEKARHDPDGGKRCLCGREFVRRQQFVQHQLSCSAYLSNKTI